MIIWTALKKRAQSDSADSCLLCLNSSTQPPSHCAAATEAADERTKEAACGFDVGKPERRE